MQSFTWLHGRKYLTSRRIFTDVFPIQHLTRFSTSKMFQTTGLLGLLIAFIYGLCSASMAFVNKAVLTSYGFNYPFFLVTCQMAFSIAILELLRLTGRTSLERFTFARGYWFIMPSIFYAANCVLSLSALSGMNIPMYSLIKRCAPVAIILLGLVILRKPLPSLAICISVGMITSGCFIAGYGDLSFDIMAYTYGLISVLSQAIYLLLVQKHADQISAAESLHLNSYNTLPMLLICSVATGEIRHATTDFALTDVGFVVTFVAVVVFGCLLNYLLFLCTTYNSALTTSVTGTIKSIFQTIVGMFTFGGMSLNVFSMSGIILNLSGGVLYTLVKFRSSQQTAEPINSCVHDVAEKGESNHVVVVESTNVNGDK